MNNQNSKQIGRSHYTPEDNVNKDLKNFDEDITNTQLLKFFAGWTVIIVSFIIAANISVFVMEKFGGVAGSVTFFVSLALLYKPIQSGLKYLQS